MRWFILGISLFGGGLICWSAWIIANMIIIPPGGVSSIISGLRSSPEGLPIAWLFFLIAIAGLIIAVLNAKDNK